MKTSLPVYGQRDTPRVRRSSKRSAALRKAIRRGKLFHSSKRPAAPPSGPKFKRPWWAQRHLLSASLQIDSRGDPVNAMRAMEPVARNNSWAPGQGQAMLDAVKNRPAFDSLVIQVNQLFDGWKITGEPDFKADILKLKQGQEEKGPVDEPTDLVNYIVDWIWIEKSWPAQIGEILGPLLRPMADVRLLAALTRLCDVLGLTGEPKAQVKNLIATHAARFDESHRYHLADHLLQCVRKGGAATGHYIELLSVVMGGMTSFNKRLHLIALSPEIWNNLYSEHRQLIGLAANKVMETHLPNLEMMDRLGVTKIYIEKLGDPIKFQRLLPELRKRLARADHSSVSRAEAIPHFFSEHVFKQEPGKAYEFSLWHLMVARDIAFQLMDHAEPALLKRDEELGLFLGSYFTLTRQVFPRWEKERRLQLLRLIFRNPVRDPDDLSPAVRGILQEGLTKKEVEDFALTVEEPRLRQKLIHLAYLPRQGFSDLLPSAFLNFFSWRSV